MPSNPTTPTGYSMLSSCPYEVNETSGAFYPYFFNYSYSKMSSASDCAEQCTSDKLSPTCNAFAWDSDNKVCYTQSGTASDTGSLSIDITNTNSSIYCYSKN